jgi:tetratricopeptide (TPR) repeat protein
LGIDGLDAPALARRLAQHTGGNPMFLLETMKALLVLPAAASGEEPLPAVASVTGVIQRRIAKLSEGAVRLARCAAVTGQDFSSELASQVLGVPPLDLADAWNELEAAQVFRGGAFAHDLIYEAALASVPSPIATLLHGQIARYLESQGHAPARVAQHWLDAGEPARGAEALLAAAKEAKSLLRFREQAELLELAAGVMRGLGERQRAYEVLLELYRVANEAGSSVDREQIFEQLMACAETPLERHAVVSERIVSVCNRGRFDEALSLSTDAVEQSLAIQAAPHLTAELRSKLGGVYALIGLSAEAAEQYRLAEPAMLEHPDPRERYGFSNNFGVVLDSLSRHREARVSLQAAADSARACNDMVGLCEALSNIGSSLRESGQSRLAVDVLRECVRLRQTHDLHAGAFGWMHLGRAQRAIGEYAASLQSMEHQRQLWSGESLPLQPLCDYALASTYTMLGQYARAQQQINSAGRLDSLPIRMRAKALLVQARLSAALGRPNLPLLERAHAMLPDDPGNLMVLAEIQLESSLWLEPARAWGMAMHTLAQAQGSEEYGTLIEIHTRCAGAALRVADIEAAGLHAREALDLLAAYDPQDLYRAEVGWVAWKALVAAGEPSARDVLEQTAAWVLETERVHVPDAFKSSFRARNRVNRELLAAATAPARSPKTS